MTRLLAATEAGLDARTAWRLLARDYPNHPVLGGTRDPELLVARVREALSHVGVFGRRALSSEEATGWVSLGVGLQLIRRVGGGNATLLHGLAEAMAQHAVVVRRVSSIVAGTRVTSGVLSLLPVVGMLAAVGMLPASAHPSSVVAMGVCFGLAVTLMALGRWWRSRLFRWASSGALARFVVYELVAIAVSAGAPPTYAGRLVAEAVGESALLLGAEDIMPSVATGRLWQSSGMRFAMDAGAPLVDVLRAEARRVQRDDEADALRRVQELDGRLLLPLGLCDLPAFFSSGVIPTVLAAWQMW